MALNLAKDNYFVRLSVELIMFFDKGDLSIIRGYYYLLRRNCQATTLLADFI